ncbi:MAG TPA: phage portal protein [Methylomirabilota bacterium]|nr:phage portal protein [Methylomirabilota bacterium]
MSANAVQLYGPRGGTARGHLAFTGNNALVQAATQTSDRKRVPNLDYDVHRNISNQGRRTMLSLGRYIYSNFPMVRGALHEQAEYASSVFLPQFYGATESKDWGIAAETWMENHDLICDVAGWPYNMRTYRRNLLVSVKRDGDMLTVLCKTATGYPMLQCIPGHRIGSPLNETVVFGGFYDGSRIIDGVIVNGYGAPLAYRVLTGENPFDYTQYQDISARDCFLSFIPEYVGQVRGFSMLGSCMFDFQDVAECRRFQLISQKVSSKIALVQWNDLGESEFDAGGDGMTGAADTAKMLPVETQNSDGVDIMYMRANAGHKLEALKNENPGANAQNFEATIVRSAFAGMDWSVDFSLDPTKIGGAPGRVVIDKICKTIGADQDLVIEPACKRWNGFRVSCAMSPALGILPWNDEWYKFSHQGPAKPTCDRKYDSDVDVQEVANGLKTRRKALANRGDYIDDVDIEVESDTANKWAAAERIAKKFKVTIETAYNSLWNEQPNGITPQAAPAAAAKEEI